MPPSKLDTTITVYEDRVGGWTHTAAKGEHWSHRIIALHDAMMVKWEWNDEHATKVHVTTEPPLYLQDKAQELGVTGWLGPTRKSLSF